MRLVLKVTIGFIVVALLLLLVLSYLEQRDGLQTSPTAILDELKQAGQSVANSIGEFAEESGLRQGAADLLQKGSDWLHGDDEAP